MRQRFMSCPTCLALSETHSYLFYSFSLCCGDLSFIGCTPDRQQHARSSGDERDTMQTQFSPSKQQQCEVGTNLRCM